MAGLASYFPPAQTEEPVAAATIHFLLVAALDQMIAVAIRFLLVAALDQAVAATIRFLLVAI